MDTAHRTRQRLIDAFWELFAQKSIERISIRELTERAGLTRGTFYLHFQDIYALLESEERRLLDAMSACIDRCPPDPSKTDLLALMTRLIALYERNREPIIALLGDRGDGSFRRQLKDLMKSMPIWRACDPCLQMTAGERDLLLGQTAAGVISLITDWLEDSRNVSAPNLLHLVYETSIKRQA
ncbi:TetR/AcrR family transcriptional regulator [Berryella wangjianweii]|uniref:TetR/AcrR family transcriptional regulator n=1 Tax=Berryella wangjianweii TaxID=2734634 RepID=A0A6M8J1L3_9ACTN|nr:TetR/AcrR family transcriptional regulator [Berryella wangjianweii]NPD31911.1 TetR/AcrR family transcriptional regulator [Eggerthellaceae bacterium zg-997]QKF07497.1 TetR/AcrR family transcriptional regulator [Berryella wangjianweii]